MHVLRMSRVGLPRAVDGLERIRTTTLLGRAVLPLAAIAVGLVGCKEGAASTQNKVTAIVGMAAIDSVRLGRTYRYTIELRDASGNRVTDRTVAWSSLNPNVAAVDANGTVTGVAIGATVIVAQVNGATAHATMNTAPASAARYIEKTECFCFTDQTLQPGESREMPVVFRVSANAPRDLTTISLSYTFFESRKS